MFLWDLRHINQFMSLHSVLDCHIIKDSDKVLCDLYVQMFIQMWSVSSFKGSFMI